MIRKLSWSVLTVGSLTLGLAPYILQQHLLGKVQMLLNENLSSDVDIFDFIMHGFFPLLLIVKAAIFLKFPKLNNCYKAI